MRNDFTTEKHESFGMLQISRTTCNKGVNLFGSSIKHNNTVRLRIYKGQKDRGLSNDWYLQYGLPLIEVELSPTQFAEAITSMNCGSGTPVTLKYVNGKEIEECPEENKRQIFETEFRERMKNLSNRLDNITDNAEKILAQKGTIKVSEKQEILNAIQNLRQEIGANIPFVSEQFNEQMDKTVLEAKGEVEAFYVNKVMSLGLKELQKPNVNLLEE